MRLYLLVLIVCAALPGPAWAKQEAVHFVSQFKQALDLRQGADKTMYANMEKIAAFMEEFHAQEGHFPEVGVEQDEVSKYFERVLAGNPYNKTGQATAAERRPCKITFAYDMQLDSQKAQKAVSHPPASWRAEPGSITITTNGSGRMLIWAASADCQPLVDPKTYTFKHIYKDVLVDIAEDGCQTLR